VPEVRKASRDDVPQLADVLARAFHEDPVFRWLFPRERRRHGHSRSYFRDRARILLRQDEVYTVDGAAGAAMWARPGEWRDPTFAALWSLAKLAPRIGRRSLKALSGLHEVEARHPHAPHWYLAVLGVEPIWQGRGVGARLLAATLARLDAEGVPAYLETSKQSNVAWYGRRRFATRVETSPARRGPPIWTMWREPSG
jgi:GNAT superfamily N-acetyltransferase